MRGPLAAVEQAVAGQGDVSRGMSRSLDRTKSLSAMLWLGGGVLFAIVATLTVMRSGLGFACFLVAALIAAFPSLAWSYAAGKHQLIAYTNDVPQRQYTGREFSLGIKVAVMFIGTFIVAAAVLVELISSKVSTTLEDLAISSSSDRFDPAYPRMDVSPPPQDQTLHLL